MRGQNADDLLRASKQIEAIVRTTPGATDVGLSTRGERPELEVDLRRVLAGTLGLTVGQVSQSLLTVGANTQGRPLSAVMGAINRRIARLQLPPGVTLSQGGDVKSENEIFGSIFAALGLAVLLMYMILVVQFGSFLDPLAILLSLPLSLIGVVLALLLTGDTLNIMSLLGVILLMGIVVKNAILLIDFARWNHERGMPLRESLVEAGRVRLRPILMTTLALIAGMIPVALGYGEGADFRAPLGRAVIGGTITSTLLTLLVIPTVYETLYGWRERLTARFRHRSRVREPAAQAGGG